MTPEQRRTWRVVAWVCGILALGIMVALGVNLVEDLLERGQ